MILRLHDVDSVKSYERELSKKYVCPAHQIRLELMFQQPHQRPNNANIKP